jgi:hypothetical protein
LTDRAAAGDEDGLARLQGAAIDRAQGDAERLGERGPLEPRCVRQRQRLVGTDGAKFSVGTGAAVAGTLLVGTEVGQPGVAVVAAPAGAARVHHDSVALLVRSDARADGCYGARELVAHHRLEDAGRAHRGPVRGVLVEVGAADAAVADVDHDFARSGCWIGRLAQLHLAGAGERHRLHAVKPSVGVW